MNITVKIIDIINNEIVRIELTLCDLIRRNTSGSQQKVPKSKSQYLVSGEFTEGRI